MKYAKILLTEDQRKEFTLVPGNISEWEIAKYYTLSEQDIKTINQNRRDYNRMGFALQLCHLRHLGYVCNNIVDIPNSILLYIAKQLNIVIIEKLDQYGIRKATKIVHIQTIQEIYGYTSFTEEDGLKLKDYLMPFAMENDNSIRLIRLTIEYLREQKIILPGITTIEKIVSKVGQQAENKVYEIINNTITSRQKRQLDLLLESSDELLTTTLAHLKEEPGQSSPTTFLNIIERLEKIRNLNLTVDLKEVHPNRINSYPDWVLNTNPMHSDGLIKISVMHYWQFSSRI